MARLKGNITFTGSLGNISAYTRKGSTDIVLRTKGGASAQKIKSAPEFANTRRVNTEFGGASTAAKQIKLAMNGLTHLDHTSFQSRLTSVCSRILKMDADGEFGQRSIFVSNYRQIFEGFNLEMGTPFDSILKHPLKYQINRTAQSASINVPELFPNISLYVPGKFSLFRFIAVLGIVPDMKYQAVYNIYKPVNTSIKLSSASIYTDWLHVSAICNEQTLQIQIQEETGISDNDSFLLSIGIEFGIPITSSLIQSVNYAGAAKILSLA
jgi:hypothetical protein